MRLALTITKDVPLPGLSDDLLKRVVTLTCRRALPRFFARPITVKLDLAAVPERTISRLNHAYRGKRHSTDVLSFGNYESLAKLRRSRHRSVDLGQIVLAPVFVRRAARADGVSWKRELVFVLSHGVLHLLGFDHSEEMFALQDAVTEQLTRRA